MSDGHDLEIKIKTKAETGGLSKITDGLRGIREKGGAAATALSGMVGLVTGPLAAGAAVFATLATAFRGMSAAVSEYAAAEEEVSRLDAALAQQGKLTESTRESYQALASEIQKTTGISDDEWIGVLARLTQFGADPKSIGMDVEAVKNLAGILNGDLQSAALAVGKAIQGNFTAFGRWGIAIDENATQTEKLQQLYSELAQRGGGQLEARSRTLAGQWRSLKNTASDLTEGVGGMIVRTGILQKVIGGLSTIFETWAEAISGTIPAVEGLTNAERKTIDTQDQLEASSRQYEKRMQSMKREADRLADALARVRSEHDATKRRQDEQSSASMAFELAVVDGQEKRGAIGAPTAIARRAGIREKYEMLKEAAALKNDLAQIQINADELKLAKLREQQTKTELAALERRKKAAILYSKSEAGRLDTLIRDLKGSIDRGLPGPENAGNKSYAQLVKEYESIHVMEATRKRQLRSLMRRRKTLETNPENVAGIDAEISRVRERLNEDSTAVDKLDRTLPDKNRTIAADAESRTSVNELTRKTGEVESGGTTRQLLESARRVAASSGELNDGLLAAFQEILSSNAAIKSRMETLRQQVANAERATGR